MLASALPGVQQLEIESWPCYFLDNVPGHNFPNTLCLCFLMYKIGIKTVPVSEKSVVLNGRMHIQCLAKWGAY